MVTATESDWVTEIELLIEKLIDQGPNHVATP